MTIKELSATVQEKALTYSVEAGESIEIFPSSIVDFVVEYGPNVLPIQKLYIQNLLNHLEQL